MKWQCRFLPVLALCLFAQFSFAQIRTDINQLQKAKPLNKHIKVDLISLITKSPTVSFERTFNDKYGLFAGIGILFPTADHPNKRHPRYFLGGKIKIAESHYFGGTSIPTYLNLIFRHSALPEALTRDQILIGTSVPWAFTDKISLEFKGLFAYHLQGGPEFIRNIAFVGIMNFVYSF